MDAWRRCTRRFSAGLTLFEVVWLGSKLVPIEHLEIGLGPAQDEIDADEEAYWQ